MRAQAPTYRLLHYMAATTFHRLSFFTACHSRTWHSTTLSPPRLSAGPDISGLAAPPLDWLGCVGAFSLSSARLHSAQ